MILKRLLVMMISSVLFVMPALSQNKIVTGKVTDSKDGSAVQNATVKVSGTTIITQTDANGNFKVYAPASATKISISSVGYAVQEVSIGEGTVNVKLVATTTALNDVIVIGYGTVRKKDLTGSVATINSKDFQKGAISTPEQMIAGKVPGVLITSNGGQPGQGSTIRVRGGASLNASNDPLIIIDGVLLDPGGINGSSISPLSLINSDDIESFTVLKDASATAIYGSRASNGVIIITTKKGKTGDLKINFNTSVSASSIGKKVGLMNADEIRSIVNQYGSSTFKAMLGTTNTDWQNEIYQTAVSTNNDITLSGGIKKLPYRLSLGYSYLNGILKTDYLEKTSFGLAINPTFFDNHLKVDINLKGTLGNARVGNQGAIGTAIGYNPTVPVKINSKRFGGYYEYIDASGLPALNTPNNPVGLLMQNFNYQHPDRSIGNIQFDYKFHFLPELRANLNLGYDASITKGNQFIPDSAASNYSKTVGIDGGLTQQSKQTKFSKLLDFYFNYTKDVKSIHSRIDATVGYSYNYYNSYIYNYRAYTAHGDTTVISLAPTYPWNKDDNATIGFFGRLVYTFYNKYILTATWRHDGSSRFAKANRWGDFPSAAFSWRISDENFIKNKSLISDLKLRLGIGQTGQQDGIANYTYYYGFSKSSAYSQVQFGPNFYYAEAPAAYNPNLKWETTTTYNAAVDYGFFNNRITGSLDFYLKKTSNLLNSAVQPAGTNFSAYVLANVGDMENKGFEFNLNVGIIRKKNVTWDINLNTSYNENKITKLTVNPDPNYIGVQYNIPSGVNSAILIDQVGHPRSTFYMRRQIYNSVGKPIEGLYDDIDRNGQINEKDFYYGKCAIPNLFYGFSTNVNINKWNAGFVLRANFNNYIYNNPFSNTGYLNQTVAGYVVANMSTNYQQTGFVTNQGLSDYYLENGSFLKMDNLYVGYNAGKIFNSKANLRFSASVQNVFTITKYKGIDPESTYGLDQTLYPRPRTFTFGANIDF